MNADDSREFYQKIRNHTGNKILEALFVYGISVRIFSGNSHQIRQLIKILEDPADPAKIMGYENLERCRSLFDELIRHFHNFLSSITTLVDHTRNLMKEDFVKSEHRQEHQSKIGAMFATDPFTQFMQDFRDYMTHNTVPILGIAMTLGSQQTSFNAREIFVDLNHLKKGHKWTAPSKKFIEANKPTIRMLKLVDDYEQKVMVFHEEIRGMFQRYYEPVINEALALNQKWNDDP